MNKTVNIEGKDVQVTVSRSAIQQLEQGSKNVVAEMELYFSCLIRKKVRFRDESVAKLVHVTDKLAVSFRPVMTRECGIDYEGDEPPLTDFPIKKVASFVPGWLRIDYKNKQWVGEFGF